MTQKIYEKAVNIDSFVLENVFDQNKLHEMYKQIVGLSNVKCLRILTVIIMMMSL